MDSTRIVLPGQTCTIREYLCMLIVTPDVLCEEQVIALQNIVRGLQWSEATQKDIIVFSLELTQRWKELLPSDAER